MLRMGCFVFFDKLIPLRVSDSRRWRMQQNATGCYSEKNRRARVAI
jgi:hypothetical protein